ncbi:hypothetical protein [Acidiferrobacter sp.]|uniref:hypothetical protein n=1 Tax=Acidiferrobacter sp. TaxID=1872107 RepID=UPI00260903E7|nr:hypothetical protein [Acidiferrobacter sp.]
MNTNCLEGMRCPHCGAEAPFDITAVTVATMYDDGCEKTAGMEWDDTSACVCKTCGHAARVGAFREPE